MSKQLTFITLNQTSAIFYCEETQEKVTVTPDAAQLKLFFQLMNKANSFKLKDDGKTITIRFPFACIANFTKTSGMESLELTPPSGMEELFEASHWVTSPISGSAVRQIGFTCEVTTEYRQSTLLGYMYDPDFLDSDR